MTKYAVVCVIGTQVGIIDVTDGVIEWISKAEAFSIAQQVAISGVEGSKFTPTVVGLKWELLNWANGQNIITSGQLLGVRSKRSGNGVCVAGKKRWNFFFEYENQDFVCVCFYNKHVICKEPVSVFESRAYS